MVHVSLVRVRLRRIPSAPLELEIFRTATIQVISRIPLLVRVPMLSLVRSPAQSWRACLATCHGLTPAGMVVMPRRWAPPFHMGCNLTPRMARITSEAHIRFPKVPIRAGRLLRQGSTGPVMLQWTGTIGRKLRATLARDDLRHHLPWLSSPRRVLREHTPLLRLILQLLRLILQERRPGLLPRHHLLRRQPSAMRCLPAWKSSLASWPRTSRAE